MNNISPELYCEKLKDILVQLGHGKLSGETAFDNASTILDDYVDSRNLIQNTENFVESAEILQDILAPHNPLVGSRCKKSFFPEETKQKGHARAVGLFIDIALLYSPEPEVKKGAELLDDYLENSGIMDWDVLE